MPSYDPFGRRIQKRVVDAQGGETVRRYVYDGEDILFELDGGDTLVTEFIHGPGIDEPLALRRGGQTYTYHADALGSIIAITDENGTIVQQYKYDAYGNIVFTLNPSFEQPYGFTGRKYDPESGLYFYRARYYDPALGRFITRDPIGFAGGDVNVYAYALSNPAFYTDPTGLITPLGGAAIGFAVGAVTNVVVNVAQDTPVSLVGVLSAGLGGAWAGATFGMVPASTLAGGTLQRLGATVGDLAITAAGVLSDIPALFGPGQINPRPMQCR